MASRSGSRRAGSYTGSRGPRHCSQIASGAGARSLFSTLFNVAAIRGKSPRAIRLSSGRYRTNRQRQVGARHAVPLLGALEVDALARIDPDLLPLGDELGDLDHDAVRELGGLGAGG